MLSSSPMTTSRTDLQVHTEAFTRIGETRNVVWQYDQEMDKLGPLLFPASQVSVTPAPRVLWMPPSNPPYMPIPTHQQPFTNTFRNTPYSPPAAVSKVGPAKYKAPAHKHAHHLHSIPPREKSTRTLIIDHMLWVHGRTRFAQARAELGMTDLTGGPSSSNYKHQQRPENYEEDDEVGSEGEDMGNLKARLDPPNQYRDENERRGKQDLPLAQSLRLRAEGLEKVVTSMLDQPPPIHPVVDDDIGDQPPSSPKINPASLREPHRLPNGVRLRLALGTIINDLFARQMPRPPYRFTHPPPSKSTTTNDKPHSSPESTLPSLLEPLSTVSGARAHSAPQVPPPIPQVYPQRRVRPNPTQHTRSLYHAGASSPSDDSAQGLRCPRHLHTQCEICVEAKPPPAINRSAAGASGNVGSTSSTRGRSNSLGQNASFRSGLSGNGWRGGASPSTGIVSGWQDGTGIGSGLSTPGVKGCTLRRKVRDWDLTMAGADGHEPCGAGNTNLSRLIPRFLRLSALVAVELGGEAKDEEEEREAKAADAGSGAGVGQPVNEGTPTSVDGTSDNGTAQGVNRLIDIAFRPTKEWYLLLAGLLTRAVLEGYLTGGWKGLRAAECLLTVGLGIEDGTSGREGEDERFQEFDPDDLPSLTDAVKLLFPSLRDNLASRRSVGEDEYEVEMFDRLRRFYDVRQHAPDLTTLMEDLAWQYPAEPIERAALRFCEAVAKWRGKPELETYKKKSASSMSIESLVHSNPTSPTIHHPMSTQNSISGNVTFAIPAPRRARVRPSISVYFAPQAWQESPRSWVRPKRPRSLSSARLQESPSKRMQMS